MRLWTEVATLPGQLIIYFSTDITIKSSSVHLSNAIWKQGFLERLEVATFPLPGQYNPGKLLNKINVRRIDILIEVRDYVEGKRLDSSFSFIFSIVMVRQELEQSGVFTVLISLLNNIILHIIFQSILIDGASKNMHFIIGEQPVFDDQ